MYCEPNGLTILPYFQREIGKVCHRYETKHDEKG